MDPARICLAPSYVVASRHSSWPGNLFYLVFAGAKETVVESGSTNGLQMGGSLLLPYVERFKKDRSSKIDNYLVSLGY